MKSIQKWIPIENVLENGIIKTNKNKYIKILKVIPINYNLKTQLEKNAILNSYRIFLKSCNFDMQIFIQSKKENLDQHIFLLRKNSNNKELLNHYINFIQEKNFQNKSISKNHYLVISNLKTNSEFEENIIQELNEKYFKIKDNLARCGNIVLGCSKDEIVELLISIFNIKKNKRR